MDKPNKGGTKGMHVDVVKNVKHPCQGCVYYKACGNTARTEPCKGRQTKTEQKRNKATTK